MFWVWWGRTVRGNQTDPSQLQMFCCLLWLLLRNDCQKPKENANKHKFIIYKSQLHLWTWRHTETKQHSHAAHVELSTCMKQQAPVVCIFIPNCSVHWCQPVSQKVSVRLLFVSAHLQNENEISRSQAPSRTLWHSSSRPPPNQL